MASMHASKLNVGFDDLMKNNITWVLARVKFEKVSKIYQDLPLVGKTWPHPHNRFDSVRDYLIFDDKGNVLAKGSSLWCLINFKTGRLLPTNSAPIEGDFVEDSVYENKLEKINYDETLLESLSTYRVVLSDIDCNQHMNNAKYAELVYNLLTKEESELLNSMEINYLQQAFLGDELNLKGYRILNEIIILERMVIYYA